MRLSRIARGVFVVLLAVAGGLASPAVAQTLVQENGRAFDASGANNSLGSSSNSGLFGSLSGASTLNLGAFTDTNLRSLSAEIDVNDTLFVPSLGVDGRNSTPFSLGSAAAPLAPSQPSAFSTSGFSTALAPQPFTVAPLSGFTLPRVPSFSSTAGLSQSAFSLTLPTPTRSFPSTIVETDFGTLLNGSGILGRNRPRYSFDEEDRIGFKPTFKPSSALPSTGIAAPRPPSNELIRTLTGENGQIYANFGVSPDSGVNFADPLQVSLDDRLKIRTDFDPLAFQPPELPGLGTGLPNPTLASPLPTNDMDVFGDVLPENSFIRETLRQAQQIANPARGLLPETGAATDGIALDARFGLNAPDPALALPKLDRPAPNVLGEMQEAVAWVKRLSAQQKDLNADAAAPPVLSEATERAMSYVRSTEEAPLSTFVGGGSDPAVEFARTAEHALKKGEYSRAVARYEVALVADRNNPLLLLGQAHAYIGDGDYFRAIRTISKAIEGFPEIAYFKIDLTQFIVDPDLLEIRRADIETRLSRREDYRFRFLLGYIEYYTGLTDFGLKNLRLAAADAPVGSPISRFPDAITAGHELRQPKETAPPSP